MYHAEKWLDGALWIQDSPNGKWHEADMKESMTALYEFAVSLEKQLLAESSKSTETRESVKRLQGKIDAYFAKDAK